MRSNAFGASRSGSALSALGLLLVSVLGCGPGQGQVSGRVMFNGAPLRGGRVTFQPADPGHNSVSADLDEQGNYNVVVLPAGEVQVSVDNRELEPPPPAIVGLPGELGQLISPDAKKHLGGANPPASAKPPANAPPKASGRYVKIPPRYYDSDTSELKFTVERGEQKRDFQLHD